MKTVKEAVKEASISAAYLLDDVVDIENDIFNANQLQKDIEHIQEQIKIIENSLQINRSDVCDQELIIVNHLTRENYNKLDHTKSTPLTYISNPTQSDLNTRKKEEK